MGDGGVEGGSRAEDRSLKAALRRARISEAEHAEVVVDLRAAELARLEVLAEELAPVIRDIPPDVEMIDCAVVPGNPPRLWIDMLGYVEMGHDKRSYRFVAELRSGRQILLETAEIKAMADRVTDYIAHRLIGRERALERNQPPPEGAAREDNARSRAVERPGNAAAFWQIAFAFVLGVAFGIVGMLVLALIVTR